MTIKLNKAIGAYTIELGQGRSLLFGDVGPDLHRYPTDRIQKGGLLAINGLQVGGEGLGFGVPILKYGAETVFPGQTELAVWRASKSFTVVVNFRLNLVKRTLIVGRKIKNPLFYSVKEACAPAYQKSAVLRRCSHFISAKLRTPDRMHYAFETIASKAIVQMVFSGSEDSDTIRIKVTFRYLLRKACTQIIIANEQGATCFNSYSDSNHNCLTCHSIGIWDEVNAAEAAFCDSGSQTEFRMKRINGAEMRRGWEMLPGRLDWSGFSYLLSPDISVFDYEIRLGDTL